MSRSANLFKVYRGLPTAVYAIFLARIVNSLGSFVYPFLTLFLTTKLGMSEAEPGFFEDRRGPRNR